MRKLGVRDRIVKSGYNLLGNVIFLGGIVLTAYILRGIDGCTKSYRGDRESNVNIERRLGDEKDTSYRRVKNRD